MWKQLKIILAILAVAILEGQLSKEQIAEGKKRARDFKPK
jgi:hypothetical protein